jgi:antitoxin component YwqK of YwqJK toxin-antitoxin module
MYRAIITIIFFLNAISFCIGQKQEFQDEYPNGKIRSKGNYQAGFEDSTWTYYFDTGVIQEISNYKKGKLNGRVLRYHPNGKLMVEGYFKNDLQDSIQKTFSADEKLLEEGNYLEGKKSGRWNYFFPGGDSMLVEDHGMDFIRILKSCQ